MLLRRVSLIEEVDFFLKFAGKEDPESCGLASSHHTQLMTSHISTIDESAINHRSQLCNRAILYGDMLIKNTIDFATSSAITQIN